MEVYQIWIGALASLLGVLISIKKLFGKSIEKWVEGKTNMNKAIMCIDKLVERNNNQDKIIANIQEGVQALLRQELKNDIKNNLSKSYVEINDYENIIRSYRAYKNNGGNCFIDEMMEELKSLPKR